MRQTSNQKQSVSYLYYFFLGMYLNAEPFFLKHFFKIYFPNFDDQLLTFPIIAIIGIAGFKKLQDATGNNDISQIIMAVQTEFANWQNPQFRKRIWSRYKFQPRDILCLSRGFSSKEPMARIRSTRVVVYLCLSAIGFCLLVFCLPYLFSVNLSYWGVFEASFTISVYAFSLCLIIVALYPVIVDETIQIENALRSEADLKKIVKQLREELEFWQIESRVILPMKLNSCFILRLLKQGKKGDIDIVVTSPERYCFVIDLKSHFGNVKWNSKLNQLCRQLGRNPEYVPFREDFIDQVKTQADKLKKHRNLTHRPDKILLFSRARVKHDRARNKRVKSKVLISYPLQLVDDLIDRNQEKIEGNAGNANTRRPRRKD